MLSKMMQQLHTVSIKDATTGVLVFNVVSRFHIALTSLIKLCIPLIYVQMKTASKSNQLMTTSCTDCPPAMRRTT